jgi:tellurite resistance protein TehA-like permease
MAIQMGSVLLFIFTAIFLAGSGINTQGAYTFTPGFHGSMLFTLSLPISRRRLLFVRAGLGALQTCILVVIMACYILHLRPETTSVSQAFVYLTRTIACTMAIYALSVLLTCVLDETWHVTGAFILWTALFLMQSKFGWVARVSPLRGMSLNCYPITAPIPWAPIVASLVFACVCLCASVLVLQRKEY